MVENNKNPERIAQVIGKWVGGGVEAVVMNYYRHIDKSKIQFDFICDEDSTNIPYEEIENLGGRVILVPPYQKIFKYLNRMTKIFKENKYKVVHSNINALSIFPLFCAKRTKVPIRIAHSHSTTNKKEWKKNLIKNILKPFSKLYANRYFCCTEHAGRWLFGNRFFENGNVEIINNAIDVDLFKYDENKRKEKRKELKIEENTMVVGHIGRFVAQKNHMQLLDIFEEIYKRNNNSKLLLIGQGPLQIDVEKKVFEKKLQDNVIFLGQRSDVNELYQAMDIFVLPSLYEGLGMVLIEAQCSGLPCVASTEVPSIAKITDNMSFISLNDKTENWANIITERFNKTIRKSCCKEVQEKGYDIDIQVKKLEEKYLCVE